MNLIEAHGSGRPFKRPHWPDYVIGNPMGVRVGGYSKAVGFKRKDEMSEVPLDPEDILATDFELEPEAKLLTRKEIGEAVTKALYIRAQSSQYAQDIMFALSDEVADLLFKGGK